MRKTAVILILASTCLFGGGRQITDECFTAAAKAWIDSADEYFLSPVPVITVNDREFGVYAAGNKGILLYSPLQDALIKHFGITDQVDKSFYDLQVFEIISGRKLYSKTVPPADENGEEDHLTGAYWHSRGFNHINPEFAKWMHENCIPSPALRAYDTTFAELYDKIFSRFFRLMTESYLVITVKRNYKKECSLYSDAMAGKKFEGLAYLDKRYGQYLNGYEIETNGWNAMTPPMAVGFWLRRGIDGSHTELWKGLSKLMKLYDRQWFETALKRNGTGKPANWK